MALPIEESSIHFPYYGDTLAELVDGLPPDKVAEIIVRGEVPSAAAERGVPVGLSLEEMGFQLQYLQEISQGGRPRPGTDGGDRRTRLDPARAAELGLGARDPFRARHTCAVRERRERRAVYTGCL